MNTFTSFKVGAKSDRGLVRASNEDAYTLTTNIAGRAWQLPESNDVFSTLDKGALFVVADGMGGTIGGEIASKLAIEAIQQYFNTIPNIEITLDFFKTHLLNAVKSAQQSIINQIRKDSALRDMGTTVCMAWVFQNYVFVCWVGDSRVYLYRKNTKIFSLTKDHSYVQELIDANKITEYDSFEHPDRNIITQSLGDESRPPQPGFVYEKLANFDRILLCSDGLNTMIRDHDIEKELFKYTPAAYTVSDLIENANKNGGYDNITAILCDVIALPDQIDKIYIQGLTVANQSMDSTNKATNIKSSRKKIVLITSLVVVLSLLSGYLIYNWMHNESKEMLSNAPPLPEPKKSTTDTVKRSNLLTERRSDYNQGKYIDDTYESSEVFQPSNPSHTKNNEYKTKQNIPSDTIKNKIHREKPEEISKVKLEVSILEFNKYYIVYNTFGDQSNCEKEIRRIKASGGQAFMGQCKGGNLFFSIARKKGFNSKSEAEKILNKGVDIRIPCK